MTLEEVSAEALLEIEKKTADTVNRLRAIREELAKEGGSFPAHIGTLRSSIDRADRFSLEVKFAFERSRIRD